MGYIRGKGGKTMKIYAIPAMEDNYIWSIDLDQGRIFIDPGQASPVLDFLKDKEAKESVVLLTHHHLDHTGGLEELKEALPDLRVYGPWETRDLNDTCVKDGDLVKVFGQEIAVLASPGHTEAGVSYLWQGHLFPGDALFKAGCGRVFTGDYRAQYDTLEVFKDLPDDTLVYPAHEYSLENLRFAKSLFPGSLEIDQALEEVRDQRQEGKNTLPTTIGEERKINPFFLAKDLDEFIAFRKKKDTF